MPVQVQRGVVSFLTSTGVYSGFLFLMSQQETLQQWSTGFLWLIVAYVVVMIAVYLVFAIVRATIRGSHEPEVTDELERLISLTAARNAGVATGLALVGFMLVAALGGSPSAMFTVLVVGQWLAGLVHDGTSIVLYRRGF